MACSVSELKGLIESRNFDYSMKLEAKRKGRPTPRFHFLGKRQCRFQEQYEREWLCGCPDRKAFFCFPCLFFQYGKNEWTTTGVKDLGNLTNRIRKHELSNDHVSAVVSYKLLGQVKINEAVDEGARLSRERFNAEVSKNREMLAHHIEAALFLVNQGLGFRGHNEGKSSDNRGNFIELLMKFSKFSGNEKVYQALHDEKVVFTGLSSDIQNDIIESIYSVTLEVLKTRIKEAQFISIMADETTDVSNTAQLALSVRLVHKGDVYEHLLDIVDVSEDRSAAHLSEVILRSLQGVGVTADKMVIGQSYDGAANMAGAYNSVQKHVKDIWSTAYFTHCYAHKWALVVRKACDSVVPVGRFFGTCQNVCKFFKSSPKRAILLTGVLPGACPTRWLSRGKSISVLETKYTEILAVLSKVSEDTTYDNSTRAEAKAHQKCMQSVEFLFYLKAFKRIFSLSDPVTIMLQRKNIDPVSVRSKIDDYKVNLASLRTDDTFRELWKETTESLSEYPTARARSASTRHTLDSGYTISGEDEVDMPTRYKGTLWEIVDILTSELGDRFGDIQNFQWVQLVHPANFDQLKRDSSRVNELIQSLERMYPFVISDKEALRCQLQVLFSDSAIRSALNRASDVATLLSQMHSMDLLSALPMVSEVLTLVMTLSLTSVDCERTFSVLRRVKNYMRSNMGQERLKHLMILAVESVVVKTLDVSDIIDAFATKKERRINLVYKQ